MYGRMIRKRFTVNKTVTFTTVLFIAAASMLLSLAAILTVNLSSAVSDGIMIGIIILIGFLVIFIALLCVRFALLAEIEQDYREIGAMRAAGMRVSA